MGNNMRDNAIRLGYIDMGNRQAYQWGLAWRHETETLAGKQATMDGIRAKAWRLAVVTKRLIRHYNFDLSYREHEAFLAGVRVSDRQRGCGGGCGWMLWRARYLRYVRTGTY